MPLTRLIFFPEPRELTDEQYAEALALGHVRRDDAPAGAHAGPLTAAGAGTVSSDDAGAPAGDDHDDE